MYYVSCQSLLYAFLKFSGYLHFCIAWICNKANTNVSCRIQSDHTGSSTNWTFWDRAQSSVFSLLLNHINVKHDTVWLHLLGTQRFDFEKRRIPISSRRYYFVGLCLERYSQ